MSYSSSAAAADYLLSHWGAQRSIHPHVSVPASDVQPSHRPKLWGTLWPLWHRAPEFAPYRDVLAHKEQIVPRVLASLAPALAGILDSLPGYYIDEIRPAAPFLFGEWMPLGYAAMLAIDDPTELRAAILAMMNYGVAVTLLDDVADTDAFDRFLGPGSSDTIARAALAHVFPADVPMPRDVAPGLQPVIDVIRMHTRCFLDYVEGLRGHGALASEFRGLLRAFLDSVVLCRKIRKLMTAGEARTKDLADLARAAPHGMTVALIGLVNFAHCGAHAVVPTEVFLRDIHLAQSACHYQNAIATLARELRESDPSNPIVLDAIERGILDQRSYVNAEIGPEDLDRALQEPRARLQAKLTESMAQVDARRDYYERLGAGHFFRTFAFGVRNLSLLYRLSLGRV